ncbi:polysaccharide biosynthesis tyrosine autokinase [Halomonas sp. MCCC 1A17488]|uniref:polysaccharide biosynthesis tyrosine autokinase n=1 Tax=unclassified Halomonas TaxID=2609666 RepID=UPI0018D272B9|nr:MULTISPECIES: polysaccharide biosynthesis tyrosine autokinase [unclassified Halomonas]MCE8014827.1 polysaccharide biosynthesis tyrosine autokinase [Halomonas sp. MCCC 1A17488]MCG3238160.1 polysaccharide biosynthesis tyrosine autokinase [Halomonas sp. MCCC 1A17488]QPP48072.1 polysaccharide biosynthesis tyrosine autokinase [Halomonas sp. SS10-MC5]
MSDVAQPSAPAHQAPADDEIDLGRLFGLLLDHKGWIVAITALFSLLGVAYALLATPIYRADALVQVESKAGMNNPLQDVRAMLGEETKADAELGILRSRLVLGRAVEQERLDVTVTPRRLPLVGDFLVRHGVERPAFLDGYAFTRRNVWAGETLNLGELHVAPALQGEAFTLQVLEGQRYRLSLDGEVLGEGRTGQGESFLDGQVTLRVAELLAAPGAEFELVQQPLLDVINDLRTRFSVSQQGRDSGLFDLSLKDADPQRAQRTLNAISQVYLTQNIQRQSAEAEQSLEFLEQQAPQVRVQLSQAEETLNAYRMQQDSVDLSLETQAILERIVTLEGQLNELEFSEAEISRRFTPSHPTYAALNEKKQQLQRERAQLNQQINNLPETQQQMLRLTRDVEVTQEIYVQLLNKMQEMNIAKASTVGNVRILDGAMVQRLPVEPKKPLIVILATLLGGMVAVGFVLVRGLLNRGVESPAQIEETGLPVYATVPLSEEQHKLTQRMRRREEKRGRAVPMALLAERAPADTSIEALRGLRTSLHFAMMEGSDNRLMITGPSPGIGKSFVSINLAAVCAQAGQRVLVIDADMRKGHIHHAFRGKSEGGLSELLAGKAALDDVLRATSQEGLSYLSRGSVPPNPSELLLTQRFSQLLEEASQRFDLVIVDTPPVLAVTDAAVVGKQCGTTMMVVRFQQNPIKELEAARRRLETAGVELKGCVLNAVERKAATAYGYGYYNYSYK